MSRVLTEAARRRTFAVISHPDAGKSTLTEALALHASAIDAAGAVHGKAGRKGVTSDWMEMEQKRGISITSAVLQFDYRDHVINLLDTPGHGDFSEDTYRVLAAVDAAVMLLDAAKGLEPQTLKLFDVCRSRKIPVLTFVNKWDRPGREALELLDEVEQTIGLRPMPVTWPLGIAGDLRGVVEVETRELRRYTRTAGGATRGEVRSWRPTGPPRRRRMPGGAPRTSSRCWPRSVPGSTRRTSSRAIATPVLFGAALQGVGVGRLLDALVDLAPAPEAREDADGQPAPARHAALRPGVQGAGGHGPGAPRPHGVRPRLLGPLRTRHGAHPRRHRASVRHEVRAVGVRRPAHHGRGGVPRRHRRPGQRRRPAPRRHAVRGRARHVPADPELRPRALRGGPRRRRGRFKQFRRGIDQLDSEGVVQVLRSDLRGDQAPVLAAVGPLQFDVVESRMADEFGAPVKLDHLGYSVARRTDPAGAELLATQAEVEVLERRQDGALLAVFVNKWRLETIRRKFPDMTLEPLLAGSVDRP